jgi:hypothetical protein
MPSGTAKGRLKASGRTASAAVPIVLAARRADAQRGLPSPAVRQRFLS